LFFFFQAEDGIRDKLVTGVQTCALPIFNRDSVRRMPASSLPVASCVTIDVMNERVGSPSSGGPSSSSTVSATWTLYPTHSFPFLLLLPASPLRHQRASGSWGFLTASAGCARRGVTAAA